MLNCDPTPIPPRQGVIVLRPLRRIEFRPPVELRRQVFIPRWIMSPGLNSTLNCDPKSWFNVQLWPGILIIIQCGTITRVIIQREILTQGHTSTLNCHSPGHNSTLNCDPQAIIPRWIVTRIKISRGTVTPGRNSTLNNDTGSWFHVELWPKLNRNLGLGSQFNVEFWPGVIIQRGILTRGHNSTWNSDPSTYLLPVELRLKKVSKFNSVIKFQQLRRVIIQRKIHWKLTPGRYSIGGRGVKILSYTGLWRFYLKAYTARQGLLLIWMFYFEDQATFKNYSNLVQRLKSSFRKYKAATVILSNNMKSPSHVC